MTKHKRVINVGDTDENADWILTPEKRKVEAKLHEGLVERLAKKPKRKT